MTLDQLRRYGEAAWRTYAAIGFDLTAVGGRLDRFNLVECVLDAGHIDQYGRLDQDLVAWRETRFEVGYDLDHYYEAVAAVAFPYSEYE